MKGNRSRKPKTPWEPWEENILRTKYKTLTSKEIHAQYLPSRTIFAIREKARTLNLVTRMPNAETIPWTDADIGILKKYYGTMTAKQLQEKYFSNRTVVSITARAQKLGIKKTPGQSTKNGVKHTNRAVWKKEDVDILTENAPDMPIENLMELLPGKTEKQIRSKLNMLRLTDKTPQYFSEKDIKTIMENAESCTINQLAALLSKPYRASSIRAKVEKLGLKPLHERPDCGVWTKNEMRILNAHMDETSTELTKRLPGRTAKAIKHRKRMLRKQLQQTQEKDAKACTKNCLQHTKDTPRQQKHPPYSS